MVGESATDEFIAEVPYVLAKEVVIAAGASEEIESPEQEKCERVGEILPSVLQDEVIAATNASAPVSEENTVEQPLVPEPAEQPSMLESDIMIAADASEEGKSHGEKEGEPLSEGDTVEQPPLPETLEHPSLLESEAIIAWKESDRVAESKRRRACGGRRECGTTICAGN